MATPLLLAQLDGDLTYADGSSGGTGTATGAVRFRDGHRSGVEAALVEEGTTNLITNPYFAVNTTGWTLATITRDTTWSYAGPASGRFTTTGANTGSNSPSFTLSGTGTVTLVLKSNAPATRTVSLVYNGTDTVGTIEPGEVKTFSVAKTGSGASQPVGIRITDALASETYNIGYLGVEAKDHATTPTPEIDAAGTIESGYTWAGTAHASASTRAAASISLPCDVPGSVMCRYSEDLGETWTTEYITTFAANNIGTYGSITHDGSDLVISSDRALLVGPVFAFDTTLTTDEQDTLEASGIWDFDMLSPMVGRFIVVGVTGTNASAPTITLP